MPTMATGNRTLTTVAAVEHFERKVREVAPWPRAVCTAAATSGINAHRDTATQRTAELVLAHQGMSLSTSELQICSGRRPRPAVSPGGTSSSCGGGVGRSGCGHGCRG